MHLAMTMWVLLGWPLPPAADVTQIMARVALNQQRSHEARALYVYNQKQLLRMSRGNGKLAREEKRDYTVTPGLEGLGKELTRLEGKYEVNGKYVAYNKEAFHYKGMDLDGDFINDMSKDMMSDGKSRDGIGHDLFPLAAEEQVKYEFRLVRKEDYHGQPVFRVAFEPRRDCQDCFLAWKGEALIDAVECQPVPVTTSQAKQLPMAVKILLGTNIKGLGFSLSYRKFADGVWFPVSYGGEFEVRGLFFYKRKISVSMANGDFRKSDVNSTVAYRTEIH